MKKKLNEKSQKCNHEKQTIIVTKAFDIHEVTNLICCYCGINITKHLQNTEN